MLITFIRAIILYIVVLVDFMTQNAYNILEII